jgi:hypothetical protein
MVPIPQGKSFFCSDCGTLYAVTDARHRKIAEIEKWVVCGLVMAEGDAAKTSDYWLRSPSSHSHATRTAQGAWLSTRLHPARLFKCGATGRLRRLWRRSSDLMRDPPQVMRITDLKA